MNIDMIINIVATVGTAIAAISAAIAARNSSSTLDLMEAQHDQIIESTKEKAKSEILLKCLDNYLNIMSKESRAIQDNQMSHAYDAQRSLIDLLWFEFQLWQKGHIDDDHFEAWLEIRKKNYREDKPNLKFTEDGLPGHFTNYRRINREEATGKVIVSYRRVWDYLLNIGYYPDGDPFLTFLNAIHNPEKKVLHVLQEHKR